MIPIPRARLAIATDRLFLVGKAANRGRLAWRANDDGLSLRPRSILVGDAWETSLYSLAPIGLPASPVPRCIEWSQMNSAPSNKIRAE